MHLINEPSMKSGISCVCMCKHMCQSSWLLWQGERQQQQSGMDERPGWKTDDTLKTLELSIQFICIS